ncbi:MAG: iron ABC transporter permease [Candidatus Margulisbacteria bacterium]|nr:iron ABC transporter permease [Candidatus Margulisiibacteriota bacterium]
MSKNSKIVIILGIISLILLLFYPLCGLHFLGFKDIIHNPEAAFIFFNYRLPRVLISFVTGAMLAISGLAFQSIFANILATPYTLGISSAASLGAILALFLGAEWSFHFLDASILLAIVATFIAIMCLYIFSRVNSIQNRDRILLLGVALNFLCSSLIIFLQMQMDYLNTFKVMHWLIGSIQNISYEVLIVLSIVAIICMALIYKKNRELDLMSLGEEFAQSKGVEVQKTRWFLIVVTSVMIGTVIAFLGPIAFVGLIIPNVCRLIVGSKHTFLFWSSLFLGGILLMSADVLSRIVMPPLEVPVGVITSFLGAIFFIYYLMKKPA